MIFLQKTILNQRIENLKKIELKRIEIDTQHRIKLRTIEESRKNVFQVRNMSETSQGRGIDSSLTFQKAMWLYTEVHRRLSLCKVENCARSDL
jgi:hypothetical protein